MRLIHPTRLAALLAPLILAAPLTAQIEGGVRVQPRVQAPGNGGTIVVWPRHLQTLQARLDSFAVALPAEERALWNGVLLRAANAPSPAAGEVRVTPVLEIGPSGGCEGQPGMTEAANRVAIIVQGGRTSGASGIIVQGGRTATPAAGIVVQGGRTQAGATPAARARVGDNGPTESLGRRLAELSLRLSGAERAVLDWLLTRASAGDVGLPPGPCNPERGCRAPVAGSPLNVSLRQALGVDPLAIGPKPEDPGRGRTEERWILRF